MTKASDIKAFFKEGRPLVEQDLDIAEQFKSMREAARVKNVDWSQIKALLKAQILDERDGTDKRVKAIVEKTDCASAYIDVLGLSEKSFSREIENERPQERFEADAVSGADQGENRSSGEICGDVGHEFEAARMTEAELLEGLKPLLPPEETVVAAAPIADDDNPYAIPDDLSIPKFLKREPAPAN